LNQILTHNMEVCDVVLSPPRHGKLPIDKISMIIIIIIIICVSSSRSSSSSSSNSSSSSSSSSSGKNSLGMHKSRPV